MSSRGANFQIFKFPIKLIIYIFWVILKIQGQKQQSLTIYLKILVSSVTKIKVSLKLVS